MIKQEELHYCKKCKKELEDHYCSHCGNPRELKRIDKKYIIDEIGSILNFDKGILYSTRELLIRPGLTIREFIVDDRDRLVKPVIFIIVTSLIYAILRQFFQFEDGYIGQENTKPPTSMVIFGWIQNNYGYGNIIMGIFIALWTKLLFRKHRYNFYEILILLCFVMGMGMLILSVFGLIQGLTQLKVMDYGSLIYAMYATWAIGQFFDKKKFTSYLKAFFSYILGMFTFIIGILLLALVIDMFI